jgi:cold shock CspA family protein
MPIGNLKYFNRYRAFGFLRPIEPEGGDDVFVHLEALSAIGVPAPKLGSRYQFTIATSPRDGRTVATDLVAVDQ